MYTLVLTPGISPQLENTNILGLPFLERVKLSAKKGGFTDIITSPVFPSPSGRGIKGEGMCNVAQIPPQYILVTPDFLCKDSFWKNLTPSQDLKTPISSKTLPPSCEWIPFRSLDDLKKAEKWLLQSLIKEEEGFMSKHLERKISLFITKAIIHTKITPNQMSLISIAIGLVGALFFMFAHMWYHIAAALLFWLHSVLDGCDGEIARLKYLESRLGGILDFWGDNVVHSAVFLCIAHAVSRRLDIFFLPALLAALAVGGTIASASFVYWRTMRQKRSSGPLFTSVTAGSKPNSMKKVIDFLARRDFIYLVIFLSAVGRVDLFLWMGALGSPIYFLVLLSLTIITPHPSPLPEGEGT